MFNYGDFYCTFESFQSVDRILRLRNWSTMETTCTSCAKEGHLSIKRIICFILINYKLVLEELDVLGEEYERPARCRKWYRQFWDFFGGLITFVRGRPDDQILNSYGWTSHGLLLTYIRLDHDFCFFSFSLLLDCRITQAVMIAELLEGKLWKLLHSKCTQCTRTTFTFNILTSVLCW